MTEEKIVEVLINKFEFLKEKIKIARKRRIFAEIEKEKFFDVLDYIVKQLNFNSLCTITGLDCGEKLEFIYHLADRNGIILNLKIKVPKDNPVANSIIEYFPSAELYERELNDLLGAKIQGLAEGKRYPLADDWPENQFPLRKDWKSESLRE